MSQRNENTYNQEYVDKGIKLIIFYLITKKLVNFHDFIYFGRSLEENLLKNKNNIYF